MIRRCAISVLALATAGTLGACSSSGGGGKTASPSPTGSHSSAPSSTNKDSTGKNTASAIAQPTNGVPTPTSDNALIKMVTQKSCSAIAGGWQYTGTIDNKTDSSHDFKVTIFFTTNPGGTVQSFGTAEATVDAGKTGTVTVSKKFDAVKSVNCVLRAVT